MNIQFLDYLIIIILNKGMNEWRYPWMRMKNVGKGRLNESEGFVFTFYSLFHPDDDDDDILVIIPSPALQQ